MAAVMHRSVKWSEERLRGCWCSSPCCHDTVMEDIASCAAPLPSPSVMPWAKLSLSSWESHLWLSLHLAHLLLHVLIMFFCVLSHPSLLNLPKGHHILLLIFLQVFFFFFFFTPLLLLLFCFMSFFDRSYPPQTKSVMAEVMTPHKILFEKMFIFFLAQKCLSCRRVIVSLQRSQPRLKDVVGGCRWTECLAAHPPDRYKSPFAYFETLSLPCTHVLAVPSSV